MHDTGSTGPLLVSTAGTWVAASRKHVSADSGAWNPRATLPRVLKIRDGNMAEQLWRAVDGATRNRQASVVSLAPVDSEVGTLLTVRPAREHGLAVLTVDHPNQPLPALPVLHISELLGLTTSEAEIALELLRGESLGEIALTRRTAVETVRGHVKNLLRKTGLPTQKHLVTLLARVASVYARTTGVAQAA